jgi:hypothetical protein
MKFWPILMETQFSLKFSRKREFTRKVEPKDFISARCLIFCAKSPRRRNYLYYFRDHYSRDHYKKGKQQNISTVNLPLGGKITKRPTIKGRILGRNRDKNLKSFLLAIQSQLYSFALGFLFLTQPLTVSTVHCKEESRKTGSKTIPTSQWFKKSMHTETSSLRTLKGMPRTLNEIVRS